MSHTKKKGLPRLIELAATRRYLLIGAVVLAILHTLLLLIPCILVYAIIEQLAHPPIATEALLSYLGWAALATTCSYALLYGSGYLSHHAAFQILYQLRRQIAVQLGTLPLGAIGTYSSGELKKIVSHDVDRIEGFVAHQIPDFIKGLTLPFLTISYLFWIDWRLAIVSFVPLLILLIWIPLLFRSDEVKLNMKRYHQGQEAMSSGIVEFVRAIPVMKIFSQTADNFKRYSESVNNYTQFANDWMQKTAPPFAIFMSFMSNALLPILALGTYLYLYQGLAWTTLALFLILGVGYIKPLFALSSMGSELTVINQGVQRIDHILSQAPLATPTPMPFQMGDICFNQVSFDYENGSNALSKVSFTLPQNSITALVGPSGAGKSTVAQLIARFWDIQEGNITIGDVDIKNIPPEELLQYISPVFQDSFLFQTTIYENIRMGMDKTEEEIIAAAQAAQCHDFILQLPQGYQTLVGATGVYLSGGEKQRIQLARAALKDAPILLLDEATAFNDPENEYRIQQAFSKIMVHKTVVIIAHRLSTITDVDQIIVLDQGTVVEQGTHDRLLAAKQLYAKLWDAHQGSHHFTLQHRASKPTTTK